MPSRPLRCLKCSAQLGQVKRGNELHMHRQTAEAGTRTKATGATPIRCKKCGTTRQFFGIVHR